MLEPGMMPESEVIDKSWAWRDIPAVPAAVKALQASLSGALDRRF